MENNLTQYKSVIIEIKSIIASGQEADVYKRQVKSLDISEDVCHGLCP